MSFVDTDCLTKLFWSSLISEFTDTSVINVFDGREVKCNGNRTVKIWISK